MVKADVVETVLLAKLFSREAIQLLTSCISAISTHLSLRVILGGWIVQNNLFAAYLL